VGLGVDLLGEGYERFVGAHEVTVGADELLYESFLSSVEFTYFVNKVVKAVEVVFLVIIDGNVDFPCK
jgi:hypothetical protein